MRRPVEAYHDAPVRSRGCCRNFFGPSRLSLSRLIEGPSRSRCGRPPASAPRWAHAQGHGACAHPGPKAIGQGVGEWQGHPIENVFTHRTLVTRGSAQLVHGLALDGRVARGCALNCERECGIGEHDAPLRFAIGARALNVTLPVDGRERSMTCSCMSMVMC